MSHINIEYKLYNLYCHCILTTLLFYRAGCWRWLRVLCQTTAGDTVFCPQLLRRVWQCRWHDECGRVPYVLVSGRHRFSLAQLYRHINSDLRAVHVFITAINLSARSWSRQRKKPSTSMGGWIQDVLSPRLAPLRHRRRDEGLVLTLLLPSQLVSGPRPRRLPLTLQSACPCVNRNSRGVFCLFFGYVYEHMSGISSVLMPWYVLIQLSLLLLGPFSNIKTKLL